jgi:epoxyqueuosine reductase
LLGEVVTTLELEPGTPIRERCGTCTRCLDACPTRAFAAPFVLDARRCVSYLSIEQKTAIDPDLRPGMGEHLFGCDDCQTVCPFNAAMGARSPLSDADGDPFAPLERWSRLRLEDLLSLDETGWKALSEGTPLKRAGRAGLARNAAIVLGNRGDPTALPALRQAAAGHDHAVVREAAGWAIDRITTRSETVGQSPDRLLMTSQDADGSKFTVNARPWAARSRRRREGSTYSAWAVPFLATRRSGAGRTWPSE